MSINFRMEASSEHISMVQQDQLKAGPLARCSSVSVVTVAIVTRVMIRRYQASMLASRPNKIP